MNHIFQKGIEMMRKIFQKILGVPADRVQAVEVTQRPIESQFKPESELTSRQINGSADGGTRWEFWRADPDGQRWFKRVTADSPMPTIQAFDAADDNDEIPADDGVQFDALAKLRRETSLLKARYLRGELEADIFGDDFNGDADND